jgi:hypothetical protein
MNIMVKIDLKINTILSIVMETKTCSKCNKTDELKYFMNDRNVCKDCTNRIIRESNKEKKERGLLIPKLRYKSAEDREKGLAKRRERYNTDANFRIKNALQSKEYKRKKTLERQKIREEKQLEIGIDNKKCKYCLEIKHKDRFRHNRLKCKDCERDVFWLDSSSQKTGLSMRDH